MAGAINQRNLIPAGSTESVYTVPPDTHASVSVNCCNTGTEQLTLRLALSGSATATDGDYLEYGQALAPGQVLERTGVVLTSGMQVLVSADVSGLNVQIYGFED